MPVLITAGLSPEAWKLKRILQTEDIIFSDATQLPAIPGVSGIILPRGGSASYIHEILTACLDNNITRIYPLKLEEVDELAQARELFAEFNIILMIPSDDWLQQYAGHRQTTSGPVSVLHQGKLIAGTEISGESALSGETGIFCGATNGQEIQYSLYIV